MMENQETFTEDAVAYSLYRHCLTAGSSLLFKLHHNRKARSNRDWFYYCAPEIDIIEVRTDNVVIAYELKGVRKHRTGLGDFPTLFDAMGQALAYLNLPGVHDMDGRPIFEGGVFDFVYAVCARSTSDVDSGEQRTLNLLPIGAMLALPDGRFVMVREAPVNPHQNLQAKEHFLQNLKTLEKHTITSRIFQRIRVAGEQWFSS